MHIYTYIRGSCKLPDAIFFVVKLVLWSWLPWNSDCLPSTLGFITIYLGTYHQFILGLITITYLFYLLRKTVAKFSNHGRSKSDTCGVVNLGFLNHEHWMNYSDTISPNGMTFARNSGWYNIYIYTVYIIKVTQNSLRRYYQFDQRSAWWCFVFSIHQDETHMFFFSMPNSSSSEIPSFAGFLAITFAYQTLLDTTRRIGRTFW